nr:glycosyltransferase family 2 protein [Propionibacteriales bacterium]
MYQDAAGVVVPRPPDAPAHDDVCVIIPVHNEGRVITEVVASVRDVFPHVVCVDDGSSDGSAELASAAGATVVRHPSNLGQGAALQTGIDFALRLPGIKVFVTFEADGQHQVRDAVAMVAIAKRGEADVILGSRFMGIGASPMPRGRH